MNRKWETVAKDFPREGLL